MACGRRLTTRQARPYATAMRFSTLFGETLRQVPSEAETPSHRLLLRAGMVAPLVAGIYSHLPLGRAVLRKLSANEPAPITGRDESTVPTTRLAEAQ